MQTIWHLKGAKAGSFEQVDDANARELIERGLAQACDGSPLQLPENHPDYRAPKRRRAKTDYPNKMLKTDRA